MTVTADLQLRWGRFQLASLEARCAWVAWVSAVPPLMGLCRALKFKADAKPPLSILWPNEKLARLLQLRRLSTAVAFWRVNKASNDASLGRCYSYGGCL